MDEEFKKIIENFENRLKRIEDVMFSSGNKQPEKLNQKSYSGLSGGLRFLTHQGFLNTPKRVQEIQIELKKESYIYSIKSVDKLLRDLIKNKILSRVQEKGKWKYAVRK